MLDLIHKPVLGTPLSSTSLLRRGLIMGWLFSEAAVPEGTAYDILGRNHGKLDNAVYTVPSKFGPGLEFESSGGGRVIVEHSPEHQLTGGGSISCWLYPRTFGGGNFGRVLDKNNGGANDGWTYYLDSTNARIIFRIKGATIRASASNSIVLNTWQHCCVTWESDGYVRHYINGKPSGSPGISADPSAITATLTMKIGNWYSGTSRGYNGIIDHMYIYNRPLRPGEISSILYPHPFDVLDYHQSEVWVGVPTVSIVDAAGQADSVSSTTAGFRRLRVAAGQADSASSSLAGLWRDRPMSGEADSVSSAAAGFRRQRIAAAQADSLSSSTAGFRRQRVAAAQADSASSSLAGMRWSMGGIANSASASTAGFYRLNRPGAAQANSESQTYAGIAGAAAPATVEELFRNRRFRLSSTYARRSFKGVF